MGRKKVKIEEEKTFLDFGFGLIDPENSDFTTLAKGIGLDPNELVNFLSSHKPKSD